MKEVSLIICRGLPGSGKSTYAQSLISQPGHNYKRINKDLLRLMLDNDQWSSENEAHLNGVVWFMIRKYLRAGYDVISDNTNLNPEQIKLAVKTINELNEEQIQPIQVIGKLEAETVGLTPIKTHYVIKVVDFNTPIELCIERDAKRPKPVGEEVIRKFGLKMQGGLLPNIDHILAKVQSYDGTEKT